MSKHLKEVWFSIIKDENHHIMVNEIDGKIVSSCVCVIIPNLTINARAHAFIENMFTHVDYRGRGYASEYLNFAGEIANISFSSGYWMQYLIFFPNRVSFFPVMRILLEPRWLI